MVRSAPQDAVGAGRAVLITGASSGIGRACALELDRRGYRVFAGIRQADDAASLSAAGKQIVPIMLDVTDPQLIEQAAATVRQEVPRGGLAGLVNNAGISVACVLEYLPLPQLRQQFEVNVFGALAVTQAMLPLLRQSQGRLVNISSLSGLTAGPYVGAYAASKHALEALSDSLRLELRKFGIQVALIEPGDIDTPIWEKSQRLADELRDQLMPALQDCIPEDVQEAYRADIVAMRRATETFAAKALPVSRVVRAVTHALTARRPKTRYRVGAKTWAVAQLLNRLPDRLRDRIVLHSLGMR